MDTIQATSADARASWAATLDRAIAGRRVEITRCGRVVAVLYGAEHDPSSEANRHSDPAGETDGRM